MKTKYELVGIIRNGSCWNSKFDLFRVS